MGATEKLCVAPQFLATLPDGSALHPENYQHYPRANTDICPTAKVFCEECRVGFCEILVSAARSNEATAIWKIPLPRPSRILAQSNSSCDLW